MLRNLRTYLRREQHARKNGDPKTENESFENVTEVTNEICVHREIIPG